MKFSKFTAVLIALCIVLAGMPAAAFSEEPAVVNNPISSDRLNLRTYASSNAPSLGRYYSGVIVTVLERTSSTWSKVRIGSGDGSATGYMMTEFLAFGDAVDKVKSESPTMYVSTPDKKSLILRATSSTSGKQMGSYAYGTSVVILGFGSAWHHVSVNGKIGYMKASSLSLTYPGGSSGSNNSASSYAVVNNPNRADHLNLRTSPSSSSASKGKFYNGVGVTILKVVSADWVQVQIGISGSVTVEGYMMTKYLAFDAAAYRVESAIPIVRNTSSARDFYYNANVSTSKSPSKFTTGYGAEIEILGICGGGWYFARSNGAEVSAGNNGHNGTGFVYFNKDERYFE